MTGMVAILQKVSTLGQVVRLCLDKSLRFKTSINSKLSYLPVLSFNILRSHSLLISNDIDHKSP